MLVGWCAEHGRRERALLYKDSGKMVHCVRTSCTRHSGSPAWLPGDLTRRDRMLCSAMSIVRQSNIVIHRKFEGVGSLPESFDFFFRLVPDPGINHVFGEDIAPQ